MKRKELIDIRLNLIRRNFHPDQTPELIAVTKKQPLNDIEYAYDAGVRDFGENRIDELLEKSEEIGPLPDLKWHFLGNIQTKKIPKLFSVRNLEAIHSVDSFKTLQNLIEKEHLLSAPVKLFFQVNTSNEKEKAGFLEWDEIAASVNLALKNPNGPLKLHGLMTMSKIRTNNFEEDARKCFEQLVRVKNSLISDFDLQDLKLSMGMSSDYEIALQVGTDYVRLGSSIFKTDTVNW